LRRACNASRQPAQPQPTRAENKPQQNEEAKPFTAPRSPKPNSEPRPARGEAPPRNSYESSRNERSSANRRSRKVDDEAGPAACDSNPIANPFAVLGLQSTASKADVKKAYFSLVRIHHPDKGGDAEKMKEINKAYKQIQDAFENAAP
jgi:hypothetical protein